MKRSTAYLAIPDSIESYYGWLASQRLSALAGPSRAEIVAEREERVNSAIASVADSYPAPYRQAILGAAKSSQARSAFYSRADQAGERFQAAGEIACRRAWTASVDDGRSAEVCACGRVQLLCARASFINLKLRSPLALSIWRI